MKKDYAIGRLARIFVACLCLFLVSPSSFAQDKDGKEDGDKDKKKEKEDKKKNDKLREEMDEKKNIKHMTKKY